MVRNKAHNGTVNGKSKGFGVRKMWVPVWALPMSYDRMGH